MYVTTRTLPHVSNINTHVITQFITRFLLSMGRPRDFFQTGAEYLEKFTTYMAAFIQPQQTFSLHEHVMEFFFREKCVKWALVGLFPLEAPKF